jgi:hypothetical protein
METAVLAPQHANPIQAAGTQTRNAAAMRRLPAARRKTLCDITNLRRPLAAAAAAAEEGQQEGPRCAADGAEAVARLVQENSDLTRLLEEREYVSACAPQFLASIAPVYHLRLGLLVRARPGFDSISFDLVRAASS